MKVSQHQVAFVALLLFGLELHAAPESCPKALGEYESYRVLSVDIKNPIGFLTGSPSKDGLRIKAGEPFSIVKYNRDTGFIGDYFQAGTPLTGPAVKAIVVIGHLSDCDPDTSSLRVVYGVFTNLWNLSNDPSIEEEKSETERPAATGAARASGSKTSITPMTGFNGTRGAFGGLNFSAVNGRFGLASESQFSANSRSGHFDLHGSAKAYKLWNSANWAGGVEYSDVPAGPAQLKEGKVVGRFSASTAELTSKSIVFRYGIALEGGHQQASDPSPAVKLSPDSSFGSLKLFAGVTGRPGQSAFTASYGFQAGSMLTNGVPTFKKHIVDLGFDIRFPALPAGDSTTPIKGPLSTGVHRSLVLETRFTAGLIQDAVATPSVERFFGGNQVRPFVTDNSWIIQSDAYIRSIRENQLGARLPSAGFGGSRFYSANATLAWTIWGRPMLPKELAEPPKPGESSFLQLLNGQFKGALTSVATVYQSKGPEVQKLKPEAAKLQDVMKVLETQVQAIPSAVAVQDAVADLIENVSEDLSSVTDALDLIVEAPALDTAKALIGPQQLPTLQTDIASLIASLKANGQGSLADQMQASLGPTETSAKAIKEIIAAVPTKPYEEQAQKTLAPAQRAISVFLRELNIYSIAPVAIVDVARVWPVAEGVHYGVGGGVRFSLVNANFTVAYAVNVGRVRPESAGAFFFKLDVTNLFH